MHSLSLSIPFSWVHVVQVCFVLFSPVHPLFHAKYSLLFFLGSQSLLWHLKHERREDKILDLFWHHFHVHESPSTSLDLIHTSFLTVINQLHVQENQSFSIQFFHLWKLWVKKRRVRDREKLGVSIIPVRGSSRGCIPENVFDNCFLTRVSPEEDINRKKDIPGQ